MAFEPALFRRFPAARAGLPRRAFLTGVTPVTPLPLAGVPQGSLFVKRDERCCPLYGGNKPRKLEFVIGRALERGSRRLVTTGGIGTHHGLATVVLGRDAGLDTTLVLVDQPVTREVRLSLRLFAAYGAELVHGRNVRGTAWKTAAVLLRSQLRGEHPTRVPTGGTGPLGNLGFVSAGLELAEQVAAGSLPEPVEIFVACGTGGTCAGLVVGLRLAGLSSRVVPVLVSDILPPSPRSLARKAAATLRRLRRVDPTVPAVPFSAVDFPLTRSQLGAGYGASTREAEEALHAAREIGLVLETTYTAKCVAELRARAARGALPDGPVLFWNTFNAVDVEAQAPSPPEGVTLPEPFASIANVGSEEA